MQKSAKFSIRTDGPSDWILFGPNPVIPSRESKLFGPASLFACIAARSRIGPAIKSRWPNA